MIFSGAGIKVLHRLFFMATRIKSVCYHSLVCKTDQWGCFIRWSLGKLHLLKYKWNIATGLIYLACDETLPQKQITKIKIVLFEYIYSLSPFLTYGETLIFFINNSP